MYLRTLTLQAIGPFVGRHTIDFADLAASGLFLLEGPTGAGKSTLIDAVVFALYGSVASAQASDERLRSTAAAPDTESFVDLVFEVPAGVFRVRRTPQYERTKRRGVGTTTQNSTVRVWHRLPADTPAGAPPEELDGYGEPLTLRPDEAGMALQQAIGLDRAQFVQTVVLPQGEFAAFLRAKPESRKDLLEKIFGTQVYERMVERLAAMRRESAAAVAAGQGALGDAVSRFVGAARLSDEDAQALVTAARSAAGVRGGTDPVEATVAAARAAVEEWTAALATVAEETAEQARVADEARAAARSALDAATATAALLERRDRLRAERAALEGSSDAAAERVRRLERARAAAGVRPLLDGAAAAATVLDAATKELLAALDSAPRGLVPGDLVGPEGPGSGSDGAALRAHLETARRDAVADAARLERPVRLEAALEEQRRGVHRLAEALDDLRLELTTHVEWLAERPQQRTALVTRRDEARALASRLAERQQLAAAAAERLGAVDELLALAADLAAAESQRDAAAQAARLAADAEHRLRTARIAGMAGVLAGGLVPGEPCPVCGSAEHPAPAVLAPDHVDEAQVDAAERERVAAVAALNGAAERAATLRGRAETLTVRVGGLDRDAVAAELKVARLDVDRCTEAGTQTEALAAELEEFEDATAQREAARQAAADAIAAAEAALTAARAALDSAEAEVLEARGEHPTVAARHGIVTEHARVADELLAALARQHSAAEQAAARDEELGAGAARAGFGTPDEARGALLPDADLAALDREVAERAADAARVAAGLAEPEIVALPEEAAVDLAAAAKDEREARQRSDEAAGLARLAAETAAAADAAGRGVVERARDVATQVAAAAPVTRLANLVGGGEDSRGLTLGTYVLMRRFEDVVAAANQRLLVMSDGRYELVRSDEKEDVRSRATGLAMRVIDHLSDVPRDPRTLSGGETFYVSLCLALGLADVVTAEAGGVDLGTLFVDEGFGSLDPHVLEQVLAELGRLRAGGRVVGVVSHVDALKQAIADRIEVRPRADGTSTLTVKAG